MSVTLPPQGSHFEDGVRSGPFFGSTYTNSVNSFSPPAQVANPADTQAPGVYLTPMSLLDMIPTPVSATLLAANQTTGAGANYLTLATTSLIGLTVLTSYAGKTTGLNNGPLLQLDSARNISITSTGDMSAVNFTVYGWDFYGIPMAEQITGPNTTTVYGKKAFYVVQGIRTSNQGTNVSAGVGNTFGLPFFLKSANYLFPPMWNNTADLGSVAGVTSAALTANPITTQAIASGVVYVTVTSTAALKNGQLVTIAGATTTDGITAVQLNITAPITIIDATHFAYVTMGNATAGGTAGGGAAVTYTANTIGVGGTIVVADETSPATITTGDVRGTYTPTSNADGTKRLTINMYSASGDTRKFNGGISGTTILANNPFALTNLSATVTVTAPSHDYTTGENVTFTGATSAHATVFNGTWAVTVVDQNTFTFVSSVASTATAADGGAAVVMSPAKGNLYQTVTSRFGITQYTPTSFP